MWPELATFGAGHSFCLSCHVRSCSALHAYNGKSYMYSLDYCAVFHKGGVSNDFYYAVKYSRLVEERSLFTSLLSVLNIHLKEGKLL